MNEYIEREKVHRLVRSLNRYAWNNPDKSKYRTTVDIDDVQFGIDKMPAADVVEVVRCKDCTEWDKDEYECSHWYGFREDDYCSYGARMDGKNGETE